jgi:uncharacterized protein YecE (DUF72 family)
MVKATPEKSQFSVKVPETIIHDKRLGVKKRAVTDFEEFLDKISSLNTVNDLSVEGFLDRLPRPGYDYAIEFRHPSWNTEGPWEMLKHYNIAAVMTDSPPKENLGFSSDI